jgi:hypothetical protein
MIHHYGSGLNALPLLAQFRQTPTDIYLLRTGYGGTTGPLTNIRQDGSMYNAFHSFPETLRGDYYSGDYGPNFLGMMLGACTYVVDDPDFGLVAYGANLGVNGDSVIVHPRDPVRRRVYVAMMGVYVEVSAGWIEEFSLGSSGSEAVRLHIVSGPSKASSAVVWVETPGTEDRYVVTGHGSRKERGGWGVDLSSGKVDIVVSKVQ